MPASWGFWGGWVARWLAKQMSWLQIKCSCQFHLATATTLNKL